jgi:hypothetical protein
MQIASWMSPNLRGKGDISCVSSEPHTAAKLSQWTSRTDIDTYHITPAAYVRPPAVADYVVPSHKGLTATRDVMHGLESGGLNTLRLWEEQVEFLYNGERFKPLRACVPLQVRHA